MADQVNLAVVYLGLGSNLGDRLSNLTRSIDLLGNKCTVLRKSPVYETEPVGMLAQGKFLNMVVEGETNLGPDKLLHFIKSIEQELGRGSAGSNAPRPIDIDILFYDDLAMSTETLKIPHPRLPQRAFVLVPMNDLRPKLKHPLNHKTVAEMLSALDNSRGVELYLNALPMSKPNNERPRGDRMYYVRVEDHFDAAHFLRGYAGKCENLHGHRYTVEVKLSSPTLNEAGLVYDFTDLKAALKPVLTSYDHVLLNDVQPFDKINPSAENIARTIFEGIKPKIERAKLESVTIWESPESSAEYREN
jgi:6-pyruvoyltetrahydropterin/6-carboxytetrahydropterin synthase